MKLAALFLIFMSGVEAKSDLKDFNSTIQEEIKTQIKKDDEAFKKTPVRSRAPASVESEIHPPSVPEKIEKNYQQIGPKSW